MSKFLQYDDDADTNNAWVMAKSSKLKYDSLGIFTHTGAVDQFLVSLHSA